MSQHQMIKRFVLDEFLPDVAESQLEDDYDLVANGVIDSLGLLKLIAWLADSFQLPVDDLELDPDNFRSVDRIAAFIASAQPARSG